MAKCRSFPVAQRMPIALVLLLASLSGCAQNYSLAPPADSEQVTVRIKVPPELAVRPIEVMYRSSTCLRTRYDGNGKPHQVDGFHGFDVRPQRLGQSDIYEVKLARDGGGACRWHLANVTFGVMYREPERFGEGVTSGGGGGVVVIFDHNNSPMGGADLQVEGDLVIKESYYPWIDEEFMGKYKKSIRLAGVEGFLKYKAMQARQIYFEPVFHSRYMVYSAGPKIKKKGNHTVFTYPDGTALANGDYKPRFDKLEAIRLAAEKQK